MLVALRQARLKLFNAAGATATAPDGEHPEVAAALEEFEEAAGLLAAANHHRARRLSAAQEISAALAFVATGVIWNDGSGGTKTGPKDRGGRAGDDQDPPRLSDELSVRARTAKATPRQGP